MEVVDLFGNTIEVSDLKMAIQQTKLCSASSYKVSPFEIVDGKSKPIKGRENEVFTVGEYNQDLHDKLKVMAEEA
ncbi:hypothetical protein [Vibrio barjaei]|uniref:hypothetical protein n=1 Tax=Vibrio barjaei TaxID=1676683 RepID=UPI002284BCCF|nr:hypothetical protein [Vibrio barjaei]MCY9874040.1 hypothetical protein [Vibrio barjaei]